MRDVLGIMLMEEENGMITCQYYASPDKAKESFKNLAGVVGQKPQRATFLKIEYGSKIVEMLVKDLPTPELTEKLDGYRLGEGPVKMDDGDRDNVVQRRE